MAFPGLPSSSALSHHQPFSPQAHLLTSHLSLLPRTLRLRLRLRPNRKLPHLHFLLSTAGGNNNNDDEDDNGKDNIGGRGRGGGGGGGAGGNAGGGAGGGDGAWSDGNHGESLFVVAQVKRKLEQLPADLAGAAERGRVARELARRIADMERSPLLRWLLQFRGFRERILADDLFLAKLAMECGLGVIANTAGEYEKRMDNFVKEIDIAISVVVIQIVADFLLIYASAPTISLQPSLGRNAGHVSSLSHNYADISFQIALGARAYLFVDRLRTIARTGPKLFALATSASVVDTGVTDALVIARETVVEELDDKVVEIPTISTPEKVEEKKWWSYFEAGAELSAGLVPTHSPMLGGQFQPAAMARASAFSSRGSSGRSGKNGTA